MSLLNILAIVSAVLLLPGIIFGWITVRKLIATTTAADRDRAAERVNQQIREARDDEREKCLDRTRRLLDDLKEMTSDRDSERAQRIALQAQINQGLRGPG